MSFIGIATEDRLSEAVVAKVICELQRDFTITLKLRKSGFGYLKSNMKKFNKIAAQHPMVVVTDLDNRNCPVRLISDWITFPKNPKLIFRVAVRETESWLLADTEAICSFLDISPSFCPQSPDDLHDPKQELLKLVRRSKNRDIKNDVLPSPRGTTSPVGLGYNERMLNFVGSYWDLNRASSKSESLKRMLNEIEALTG